MKVKDVMATIVVTVTPHNSVKRAVGIMLDKHVSGLPVVDDEGTLVGRISEGDLLRNPNSGSASSLRPNSPHLRKSRPASM